MWVNLALEILVERPHLGLVRFGGFRLVFVERCELDLARDPEDVVRRSLHFSQVARDAQRKVLLTNFCHESQAVVHQLQAAVSYLIARERCVYFVFS